jgi:hypothetical protein
MRLRVGILRPAARGYFGTGNHSGILQQPNPETVQATRCAPAPVTYDLFHSISHFPGKIGCTDGEVAS